MPSTMNSKHLGWHSLRQQQATNTWMLTLQEQPLYIFSSSTFSFFPSRGTLENLILLQPWQVYLQHTDQQLSLKSSRACFIQNQKMKNQCITSCAHSQTLYVLKGSWSLAKMIGGPTCKYYNFYLWSQDTHCHYRSLCFNAAQRTLEFVTQPSPMHSVVCDWFSNWASELPGVRRSTFVESDSILEGFHGSFHGR